MSLSDPRTLADFADLLPVSTVQMVKNVYQTVDGQAARSLRSASRSGSGSTRVSAMAVMKLLSAAHRGRQWTWR